MKKVRGVRCGQTCHEVVLCLCCVVSVFECIIRCSRHSTQGHASPSFLLGSLRQSCNYSSSLHSLFLTCFDRHRGTNIDKHPHPTAIS